MATNINSVIIDGVAGATPATDGQMVYDSTAGKFVFQENGSPVNLGELVIAGEAHGDILYRNATDWVRLAPGTAGQVLQTNGAAANPTWAAGGGGSFSTYTERRLAYTIGTSGSWQTTTFTGATANSLAQIVIRSTGLANLCGVRQIGSVLTTRRVDLAVDGQVTMFVLLDGTSQLQVYAENSSATTFFVMAEFT